MSIMQITYLQAKQLTVDGLNQWMNSLPAAQRNAPILAFDMKSWSIPQMIAQVQSGSDVGRRYVYYYVGSLRAYTIVG